MSDLVRIPEDRFSQNEAHMIIVYECEVLIDKSVPRVNDSLFGIMRLLSRITTDFNHFS